MTTPIQRYVHHFKSDGTLLGMDPVPNGAWCASEDVSALERERDALVAEVAALTAANGLLTERQAGHADTVRIMEAEVARLRKQTIDDAEQLALARGGSALVPMVDDVNRCAVCGWTLAASAKEGCVRGNCSMRPLPDRWYNPKRARQEGFPAPPGQEAT